MEKCLAGKMKNCEFVSIPGKVRDRPEIGIKRCLECGIKIHDLNIQDRISYESGTMWGHSTEILDLKNKLRDDDRRNLAIRELCEKNDLKKILDFG
jgi:hypothetical protein